MKILVTGGGGFLGSYIVRQLLEQGHSVRSMGRSPQPQLEAMGVECFRGDIADTAAVSRAVQGVDAVIHTAAKAGVWGSRESFYQANVVGTRNVVAACRAHGVSYLVHTSTPSVVFTGESFEGADESLPYGRNFICHYAETKAEAEREALAANGGGLSVCALRPHLIWGEGDPHLLPRVFARARSGKLRMVGDGQNRVDITHVQNAAQAHVLALDALIEGRASGRSYFISQGEPVELWPWLNSLLQQAGLPPVRRQISLPAAYRLGGLAEGIWSCFHLPGEPPITRFVAVELAKSHWFNISAARRDLGYHPTVSTAEGAAAYIRSLKGPKGTS